ncbi:MAG: hypothetical protein AB7P31_12920 [Steroidobacteraceae bacterium]
MSPLTVSPRAALVAALLSLAGCGSVEIAPEPVIPKPLVRQMPVKAAVLLAGDQRAFRHIETRSGVDWQVSLGAGHQRLARDVFGALFADVRYLDDAEAARRATDLAVIFEPRMEQYSFATAKETGNDYYAVTIRYRINVFAQGMKPVDSYTITGYGSSRDQSMSSSEPLEGATRAAMRDAAAKFLVQFPRQPIGQQLARGEALVAPAVVAADGTAAAEALKEIEAVPVVEPQRAVPAPKPRAEPAPVPVPPAEPPSKTPLRAVEG